MSKSIKNEDVRNTANVVEAEVIETKPETEEKPLTPKVVGEEPKKEGWLSRAKKRAKKSKAAKIVLTVVGAVGVVGTGVAVVTSVGKKNYNEGYNKGFDDGMDEGWNQWGDPAEPDTEEPDTFEEPTQEDYPEE